LGACEAPPVILSIFLGEHLTEVLNSIEESRPIKNFSVPEIHTIKLGGTALDVKVASLPTIARDLTDRNRTSPFAFTGNKFEFRAVGSKQSPAFPVTILNAAVASALQDVSEALRAQMGAKPFPSDADKLAVIKKFIVSTKNIRFEGDGYSEAWVQEAEKRGLPNIRTCPEAFEQLLNPHHQSMLTKLGIFSQSELTSRFFIMNERYAKDLVVEANTMKDLLSQQILPAAFEYRGALAKSVQLLNSIEGEAQSPELSALKALTPVVKDLQAALITLDQAVAKLHAIHDDPVAEAKAASDFIVPAMQNARIVADKLETLTADKFYPIPRYSELLWF
jgi:glutamine synthetase